MNWYLEAFRKFATFSGRARRKEYWMFVLFNMIISIILTVVDAATGTLNPVLGMGLLSGFYTVIVLIPALALTVRRLHDIGRSGWWLLILFIPLIGAIVFLVFTVMDSKDENEYGMNPKLAAV